jgi:hypothetical protein
MRHLSVELKDVLRSCFDVWGVAQDAICRAGNGPGVDDSLLSAGNLHPDKIARPGAA